MLDDGIPAVLWVPDVTKPFEYKLVDPGAATTPKDLWLALVTAAGNMRGVLIPPKEEQALKASAKALQSMLASVAT